MDRNPVLTAVLHIGHQQDFTHSTVTYTCTRQQAYTLHFWRHAAHSLFYIPQNSIYFMTSFFFFGHIIFTFYIERAPKFKCTGPSGNTRRTSCIFGMSNLLPGAGSLLITKVSNENHKLPGFRRFEAVTRIIPNVPQLNLLNMKTAGMEAHYNTDNS
jgi:hypothetical protein